MTQAINFSDILNLADALPVDEKETMIEVLTKRAAEQRRRVVVREVHAADQQCKRGKANVSSAAIIMRDILA